MNLKWLSVVENKLQSLNGIEALTKLTVSSTDINFSILNVIPYIIIETDCIFAYNLTYLN